MNDVLVTGTDTGVGKTMIAAALVKALRARAVRAIGFKPVETGVEEGRPSDSDLLARVSADATPLTRPLLQLSEPLAPAVAAERAGVLVQPEDIEKRIDMLRRAGYCVVVEGAGGVLVPLAWEKGAGLLFRGERPKQEPGPFFTVVDLAERCGLEAIIVARAGLGTLNHVALTVAMLRARKIPIRGIVLNGRASPGSDPRTVPGSDPDLAEATNPAALARMVVDIVIVEVPLHSGSDPIEATVPHLGPLIAGLAPGSDPRTVPGSDPVMP